MKAINIFLDSTVWIIVYIGTFTGNSIARDSGKIVTIRNKFLDVSLKITRRNRLKYWKHALVGDIKSFKCHSE